MKISPSGASRKQTQYKPKQTQTNPISEIPKMNVNSIVTKDYENTCPCGAPKNKPNSNPIPQKPKNERKLIVNKGLSKSALRSVPENKPNQTQSQDGQICNHHDPGLLLDELQKAGRRGANSMLELRTALFSDLWDDAIAALSA